MSRDTLTKRIWQNAGAPVDGVNGTYAAHEWLEKGDLLVDTTNGTLYQNTNTQASPTWTQITSGGVTLDSAYDYGGAGAGKAVTVDSGAIALTNNAANDNGILTITKNPAGAQAGDALTITVGAQATGAAIVIANTGSGNDITGSGSTWTISKAGAVVMTTLSSTAHTLLESADPAGTVCYIVRDDDGDVHINALVAKTVNLRVAGTDVVTVAGATVTIAQATTISAGGLTVSAGGAAVTGNSTITGDLQVTGSLTFGGNWTVAATLTVDELILDTDGVAPAGTNCYAVRDNAGDLTVNTVTGKQFIVAVNNTDEYTFSATILDFSDNAADNVGFLILNAATAPAITEVYLVNDNTGDLTLNALTGKDILFAINGVDEVKFDDAAAVFNEASNDRDFRVESNGLQYAVYVDGGKDCVVIGDNTDISSADAMLVVGNLAKTATNNTSTAIVKIVATASFTGQGTNPVMASLWVDEPNLTAGGATITNAASLYVSGAPTEGATGNYAIMAVGTIGLIKDDNSMVFGAGADWGMYWSTADADNHAATIWLGASHALHICEAADFATDWNVAADAHPSVYVHSSTTPATDYLKLYHDASVGYFKVAAGTFALLIDANTELAVSATVVNVSDNTLSGSTANHTADTADGCLYLQSTTGTKGFVCIANADLGLIIGSDGSVDRATTVGTNCLHIFNGTAPVGTLTNGVSLYSEAGEMKAMDAAGNVTVLSPHTEDGAFVIHSYSPTTDKTITIHLEKLVKALGLSLPDLARYMEIVDGYTPSPQPTLNAQIAAETAAKAGKGDAV